MADPIDTVFRGSIVSGKCMVPSRLPNGTRGMAMLDTGAEYTAASQRLATSNEIAIIPDEFAAAHGLGGERSDLPLANVEVVLVPNEGESLGYRLKMPVTPMAGGFDFVIGMHLLMAGTLTVDGPRGCWEWRVHATGPLTR